jgi:hypothetical protein
MTGLRVAINHNQRKQVTVIQSSDKKTVEPKTQPSETENKSLNHTISAFRNA